jgi:hypothetical protein
MGPSFYQPLGTWSEVVSPLKRDQRSKIVALQLPQAEGTCFFRAPKRVARTETIPVSTLLLFASPPLIRPTPAAAGVGRQGSFHRNPYLGTVRRVVQVDYLPATFPNLVEISFKSIWLWASECGADKLNAVFPLVISRHDRDFLLCAMRFVL